MFIVAVETLGVSQRLLSSSIPPEPCNLVGAAVASLGISKSSREIHALLSFLHLSYVYCFDFRTLINKDCTLLGVLTK